MKNLNREFEQKKKIVGKTGSILAYVLIMMMVVSIIMVSMLQYITSQIKLGTFRLEKEEAFQVAEAGVYYYRWYLAHNITGKTVAQIDDFWKSGNVEGVGGARTVDFKDPEGGVIGQYSFVVTPPVPGSTIVMVTSTGWTSRDPNVKRVVRARFRRPSWSEYLFLSDSFINFGTEAEVYGKVFSNDGIRFDGKAHNTVSSALPSFYDSTYGGSKKQFGVHTTVNPADPTAPAYPWPAGTVPDRPDVFMGGREFPEPEVNFNGIKADLADMKTQAINGNGKYFDNDGLGRRIILKTNETYDVCTVNKANNNIHSISEFKKNSGAGTCSSCGGDCLSNYPIVNGGVIFVENNAWVDGSVNNKRITIAAANLSGSGDQADIYIGTSNSNLRYAAYDCSNKIGLVAQHDVRVLGSCPAEYIVDAAILAQNGTVGINDNGFSGKTSLTFNGAIVSYLQPYFAHGNDGFAVRFYNFDNDLLYCPPPYFPTGTEYAIDLWEEL